jgi:hypothetical protein
MLSFSHLKENPRKIFLIDLAGACFSFIIVAFIVGIWPQLFGITIPVIKTMMALAFIFGMYSYKCYNSKTINWRNHLAVLAFANMLYILFIMIVLFIKATELTGLGVLYLIGEMVIIGILVRVEMRLIKEVSQKILISHI